MYETPISNLNLEDKSDLTELIGRTIDIEASNLICKKMREHLTKELTGVLGPLIPLTLTKTNEVKLEITKRTKWCNEAEIERITKKVVSAIFNHPSHTQNLSFKNIYGMSDDQTVH